MRQDLGTFTAKAFLFASASAGGMLPIGSNSRWLLNQSTHSSVAYSTASNDRLGAD